MGVTKNVKKRVLLLANRRLRISKYKVFLVGSISFSWILVSVSMYSAFIQSKNTKSVLGLSVEQVKNISIISPVVEITQIPSPTPTSTPTPVPTLTPTRTQKKIPTATATPAPQGRNPGQYTAEKLNDVTWRVKDIETDSSMASAQDIVNALNNYRNTHGLSNLIVDAYLSNYAAERANTFASSGSLDSHAGFQNFMNNGGFDKAGFNSLGENSAYISGPMSGDKIVKSIFGADSSHDGNQLDNWTHVGVGVNGVAVNVNFGKNKK